VAELAERVYKPPIKCGCGFNATEAYLKPAIDQGYEFFTCPSCGKSYRLKPAKPEKEEKPG